MALRFVWIVNMVAVLLTVMHMVLMLVNVIPMLVLRVNLADARYEC